MAAEGLLSKGITFEAGGTLIPDLQEVPDLGGDTDTVEVTTLADGSRRYIKGLIDYGDLDFTFLFDTSEATSAYRQLKTLEDAGDVVEFVVTLPDDTTFTFSGEVTTSVNGASPNDALTFVASISLNTAIAVVLPTI